MDDSQQCFVRTSIDNILAHSRFKSLKRDLVKKGDMNLHDGLFGSGEDPAMFENFADLEDRLKYYFKLQHSKLYELEKAFEQYSKKGLNNYCASAITEIAANLNNFDADERTKLCHNLLESENSPCIQVENLRKSGECSSCHGETSYVIKFDQLSAD